MLSAKVQSQEVLSDLMENQGLGHGTPSSVGGPIVDEEHQSNEDQQADASIQGADHEHDPNCGHEANSSCAEEHAFIAGKKHTMRSCSHKAESGHNVRKKRAPQKERRITVLGVATVQEKGLGNSNTSHSAGTHLHTG